MLFSTAVILESITSFFSEYGSLVLLLALSGMTVFRREMSCNHCYVEEAEGTSTTENSNLDWDDEATEEVLESAGSYCTFSFLLKLGSQLSQAMPPLQGIFGPADDLDRQNPEDLLERAGYFYSGYPFTASLLQSQQQRRPSVVRSSEAGFLSPSLPLEIQMNVLMFLSPRDLVNVACVSRASRQLIEEGETSRHLWKENFLRDFGWLVSKWKIGIEAVNRSAREICYSKDFYFTFGISFLNYMLAGQNTRERCLVGIGGHVYDLSQFLAVHPGSPETVLAHAGMDGSMVFTGINHSLGALKMARSLCVVVDLGYVSRGLTGVRPARSTAARELMTSQGNHDLSFVNPPETFHTRSEIRHKATLQKVRSLYQEQEAVVRRVVSGLNVDQIVGEINPFLDPVDNKWKAWYTTSDFDTVFIDDLPYDRRLVR